MIFCYIHRSMLNSNHPLEDTHIHTYMHVQRHIQGGGDRARGEQINELTLENTALNMMSPSILSPQS